MGWQIEGEGEEGREEVGSRGNELNLEGAFLKAALYIICIILYILILNSYTVFRVSCDS